MIEYWVDPVNGNDSNSGSSPSDAVKRLDKIRVVIEDNLGTDKSPVVNLMTGDYPTGSGDWYWSNKTFDSLTFVGRGYVRIMREYEDRFLFYDCNVSGATEQSVRFENIIFFRGATADLSSVVHIYRNSTLSFPVNVYFKNCAMFWSETLNPSYKRSVIYAKNNSAGDLIINAYVQNCAVRLTDYVYVSDRSGGSSWAVINAEWERNNIYEVTAVSIQNTSPPTILGRGTSSDYNAVPLLDVKPGSYEFDVNSYSPIYHSVPIGDCWNTKLSLVRSNVSNQAHYIGQGEYGDDIGATWWQTNTSYNHPLSPYYEPFSFSSEESEDTSRSPYFPTNWTSPDGDLWTPVSNAVLTYDPATSLNHRWIIDVDGSPAVIESVVLDAGESVSFRGVAFFGKEFIDKNSPPDSDLLDRQIAVKYGNELVGGDIGGDWVSIKRIDTNIPGSWRYWKFQVTLRTS